MTSRTRKALSSFLTVTLAIIVAPAFAEVPDGVSPGAVDRIAEIEGRCPSFFWGAIPEAIHYELVAYHLPEDSDRADLSAVELSDADQVVFTKVSGTASAWAPELAGCFTPGGEYVWFVRAVYREEDGEVAEASEWSYGRYFSISSIPSAVEVEEALRVLRRFGGYPVDPRGLETEAVDTKRPAPTGSVAARQQQQIPKSVTSAKTAIKGTVSDATGETYGVVGTSNSPDGAGVAAANTNGGPDLVLDGSEDYLPDAEFSQSGINRPWGSPQTFNIHNSTGLGMTLQVDGVDVVTTQSDLDSLGALSCGSKQIAKWTGSAWECLADEDTVLSEAQVDSFVADNGYSTGPHTVDTDTTYNAGTALSLNQGTFNVSVGAGNGLDADLLDGQHASAIIAAANSEMRTPISSIPFTISESGSYYLTQNLTMLSSTSDGIEVLADNVTIDMMGFTMEGATNSQNGIDLDTQNNVVIYNGTIINFPWAAIYQNSATPGNHAFVENVRVVENGYTTQYPSAYPAIALTGSDNVVSAVYAINNTADGIRVGPTSVVKDSTSTNNGKDGITVGISSSALNNIVANNQAWGLIGGWGSAIIGNTVYSNNQGQATNSGGLRVFRGSQVENNTVYNNYHSGLWVFSSTNVLRNNHVTSSQPVSGDYYCFYFSNSFNVAIGNTATGCSIEFGGAVLPAARFVDNFQW